jgi:hypothetical protein
LVPEKREPKRKRFFGLVLSFFSLVSVLGISCPELFMLPQPSQACQLAPTHTDDKGVGSLLAKGHMLPSKMRPTLSADGDRGSTVTTLVAITHWVV